MDYSKMSIEQLEVARADIYARRMELADEMDAVAEAIEDKMSEVQAMEAFDKLPDGAKAALIKAITAGADSETVKSKRV